MYIQDIQYANIPKHELLTTHTEPLVINAEGVELLECISVSPQSGRLITK
jgi:hypothetical protein